LNTLLQGPYFTEIDLMHVAREIDEKERQVMIEMGTETPDFIRFVAEDSGNVADDGNYSVQVRR
jgi:ataxin-3